MNNPPSSSPLRESHPHGRRILVCLDRSPSSEVCVPYALSLAHTFDGEVTLLHVIQPHREQAGRGAHDALAWELSRQEARSYLERVEGEVARTLGRPVDLKIEQGRPAERIVDLAREIGADITVLGSRGEGGAPAWSLGSTVQQVLASAHTSVLIVHASSTAPAAAVVKRILVPLDGSLRSESVLPTAARIASAQGADLLLVHVVEEPRPTAMLHAPEDLDLARSLATRLESSAKKYLERLRRQWANEVPSVHTLVARRANEHQCLLEISQHEQTDLVVLSAHGAACDSAQSFGSVTTYFLTHSMVPLLVLQDLPEYGQDADREVDAMPAAPRLRASYAPESL